MRARLEWLKAPALVGPPADGRDAAGGVAGMTGLSILLGAFVDATDGSYGWQNLKIHAS